MTGNKTMWSNKELAAHLRALGTGEKRLMCRQHGICGELHHLVYLGHISNFTRLAVTQLMRGWPKASGSYLFPVPHPNLDPADAFLELRDLWADDEYGDNRRELCRWLADRLEKEDD